jgi:hypothetical protein
MTILHLGVLEFPYAEKGTVNTGDVAEILEDKYGVMEVFSELHHEEIENALVDSVSDAIENIMNGAYESNNIYGDAEGAIEKIFKLTYLDNEEMAGLIDGVPTQASLDRRSLRFKDKISKNKKKLPTKRPSFIETGLYQSSFKAWVDNG